MKKFAESVFLLRIKEFEDIIPERFNIYAAIFSIIWAFLILRILRGYLIYGYIINCIICYLPILVFFIPNIKYVKHLFSSKSLNFGVRRINTFVFLPFCIVFINITVKGMLSYAGLVVQSPQNFALIKISIQQLVELYLSLPLIITEDIINIILLILSYKILSFIESKHFRLLLSVIISSIVFGSAHISSLKSIEVAKITIIACLIFMIFLVYSRNIWVIVSAHLIQDFLGFTSIYSHSASNEITKLFFLFNLFYILFVLIFFLLKSFTAVAFTKS